MDTQPASPLSPPAVRREAWCRWQAQRPVAEWEKGTLTTRELAVALLNLDATATSTPENLLVPAPETFAYPVPGMLVRGYTGGTCQSCRQPIHRVRGDWAWLHDDGGQAACRPVKAAL
jgi:hypothetical protein